MEKYRAAIIGCGRIASTFDDDSKRKKVASHAGAYSATAATELVAAADIDRDKLATFGRRWSTQNLYTDYREMLTKEKPDIVSVCTWPASHFQAVADAVAAGAKAVFCEKPITNSLEAADTMVRLCAEKGVILAINHFRRWDALHQEVKAQIDIGDIGNIQQASFYYVAGLINSGSHMLDLLLYLLGDVTRVQAMHSKENKGDDLNIDGFIEFVSGATATLQSLDVESYYIFDLDIYGTDGRILITDCGARAIKWPVIASPLYSGYKALGAPVDIKVNVEIISPIVAAMADIVKCLDNAKSPRCSGDDGRKALELICAFHESLRTNGPVALPLRSRDFAFVSQ